MGDSTRRRTTRVLLVEHHASFRQAMAFILEREPGLTVVGQAGTLAEARAFLCATDVVLLALQLPDGNGTQLITELHSVNPEAQALVLSGSGPTALARAVRAGAAGVLPKTISLAEVIDALRRVGAGEVLANRSQLRSLSSYETQADGKEDAAAVSTLTRREAEVLGLLGEGLGDKEIAARLYVSSETIKTHMANILNKLGAESRLQALIVALRQGIITLD